MWVLNCGGNFPTGIFDSKEKAEEIIKKYDLKGTLTKYPINTTVYDWTIKMIILNQKMNYTIKLTL